jgi:hypothetical protein
MAVENPFHEAFASRRALDGARHPECLAESQEAIARTRALLPDLISCGVGNQLTFSKANLRDVPPGQLR